MSTRKRRRRRNHRGRPLRVLVGTVLALVLAGVAAAAIAVTSVVKDLGPLDTRDEIRLGQNTRIYDRSGGLLGRIAGTTNRSEVKSERIPDALKEATVAIEDKRFYTHSGVDYYRLVGAAVRDVAGGGGRQGGSTITMQLVKNLYYPRAARDVEQKIKEAYRARQVEEKYTKDEILTKYLNGVFYGNNAVGVQAASLTYFNKNVWQINLPQAALLAGLPQAPSAYNPFANPDAARERRNLVIDQMADQGMIAPALAEKAKKAGLGLKRGKAYQPRKQGYFFEYVRDELVRDIGKGNVQRGGWRVETTLSPAMQKWAEEAMAKNLNFPDAPAAAIVMIDARTGYIRVMATSKAYGKNSLFNYATQATRQPGSTFKVFVLTEAVKQGINPYSTSYASRDLTLPEYGNHTVDGTGGVYTVARGVLASNNSVFTQLALDEGLDKMVETAYEMGIPRDRELGPYPATALGGLGIGVTPLDMATAYAPLANGGRSVKPIAITRIVGAGAQKYADIAKPVRTRVLTDGQAYEVTKMLRANILGGTGVRANIGVPAAGKTGTTEDNVDAWFVGYTPDFVTAVWVGYPNDTGVKRYMNNVPGWGAVQGGGLPAQIWHDYMSNIAKQFGAHDWEPPSDPVSWSPFSSAYTRYAATVQATTSTGTTTTGGTTTGKGTTTSPGVPAPQAEPLPTPTDIQAVPPPAQPVAPPAPDPVAPPATPPPATPPPATPPPATPPPPTP